MSDSPTPSNKESEGIDRRALLFIATLLIGVTVVLNLIAPGNSAPARKPDAIATQPQSLDRYRVAPAPPIQNPEYRTISPIEALMSADATDLQPHGELGEVFNIFSDFTNLQRDLKLKEIRGKVVNWRLPVYEISISGNEYLVHTSSRGKGDLLGKSLVGTFTYITPKNEADRQQLESLKTGDIIEIKGVIKDISLRNIEIRPAIISPLKERPEVHAAPNTLPESSAQTERHFPPAPVRKVSESMAQYINRKFGFSVIYPSKLLVSSYESENADGASFWSADKSALLTTFGTHHLLSGSLKEEFEETVNGYLKEGNYVTYKGYTPERFVVGGLGKEQVFFLRRFLINRHVVGFKMTYPVQDRDIWDPVIDKISENFIPSLPQIGGILAASPVPLSISTALCTNGTPCDLRAFHLQPVDLNDDGVDELVTRHTDNCERTDLCAFLVTTKSPDGAWLPILRVLGHSVIPMTTQTEGYRDLIVKRQSVDRAPSETDEKFVWSGREYVKAGSPAPVTE